MMYSPVVVAGSNTHNNMTNKKIKQASGTHVFKGCRDSVMTVTPRSTPGTTMFPVSSSSTGNGNAAFVLAPLGLTSVTLASGQFSQGVVGNVFPPVLRGLYNKAVDFQWYRVSRAKVVFVSNQGSTCIGRITLAAYSDPIDVTQIPFDSFVSGSSTKTFDVSSAANKEVSISLPVDSSWKKVSSALTSVANVYPFVGVDATSFATIATVGDLSFGAFAYSLAGFGQGTAPGAVAVVGTFYIDYDVEFKGVIDAGVNN